MPISKMEYIALGRVIRADFMKAFNNGEPTMAAPFVMETTSTSDKERYDWLGQVPAMKEWLDERQKRGLNQFSYEILNKSFESTLDINRDDYEDDKLGFLKIRIADMAKKAKTHPWALLMQLIASGETATCYDGQAFFSASHVEGKSGTQSNLITGTGTSIAQVKADFLSAKGAMMAYKDDQGEPANEGELSLTVLAPVGLQGVFTDLFQATMISNTTNTLVGQAKTIYSSRLTGNSWYLIDTGSVMKPFIQQNRRPIEFSSLEGDSDQGFRSKIWSYGVDYRIGMGFGLWTKCAKIKN